MSQAGVFLNPMYRHKESFAAAAVFCIPSVSWGGHSGVTVTGMIGAEKSEIRGTGLRWAIDRCKSMQIRIRAFLKIVPCQPRAQL